MAETPEVASRAPKKIDFSVVLTRPFWIGGARTSIGTIMMIYGINNFGVYQQITNIEVAAATKFPAPTTPTPLAEMVETARQIDTFYLERQTIEAQQVHIPNTDRDHGFLTSVLEQDKRNQLANKNREISAFRASPEYKTPVAETILQKRDYEIQVLANSIDKQSEIVKLKKAAGINWFSEFVGSGLPIPIGLGLVMTLGWMPNWAGRPSWPFREIPVVKPPQSPTETPQTA